MTTTVVDTSALLALLYPDDEHNDRAVALLRKAAEDGGLVVNPVVYAELAADDTFDSSSELDYFLTDTGIDVVSPDRTTVFRAGETFQRYLSRRGDRLQCPACGAEATFPCPDCGTEITARQHIAADFLIGAHAETAEALLTFDAGFYREYFDVAVRTVAE